MGSPYNRADGAMRQNFMPVAEHPPKSGVGSTVSRSRDEMQAAEPVLQRQSLPGEVKQKNAPQKSMNFYTVQPESQLPVQRGSRGKHDLRKAFNGQVNVPRS